MATPLFERSGALTLTAPKANSEGVEYFAQNLVMAIGGVESVELRTGGKVAKTMPEAEAMIQKNWYETLAGFDAEGRMRFAQTGNADGVDVSEDAQGIIQAWGENGDPLMFTHNHPGAMLPGVGTLTVSPGDLWVTLDAHAAGIRAISPEGGVFEVRYGPPSQRPTPPVIVGEKLTLGKWASVLWGEARRQAAFELQVVGYPSREHVEKVRYRYPGRAIKHFRDIAPPELLQYIQFKYKRPPKGK